MKGMMMVMMTRGVPILGANIITCPNCPAGPRAMQLSIMRAMQPSSIRAMQLSNTVRPSNIRARQLNTEQCSSVPGQCRAALLMWKQAALPTRAGGALPTQPWVTLPKNAGGRAIPPQYGWAARYTSTTVDQHQWRWTPWGPYPCHPGPSIQAGRKRRLTESQPSDYDGTDEDDINPYLTESEHRDLLSDCQSDTDSDSEQDEPPAKRRCVPTKDTVKFLGSIVEKPSKNEKQKTLANKFPPPSCDPAHPPKLDELIVCLIPKTARSYDRFLSKLQQFSMDAMGPLIYLQEQMEAKTQVEGDTIKAALKCSLTLLGNTAAHVSVERRK